MAEDELGVVRLREDYYRDGFYKMLLALGLIGSAIISLGCLSLVLVLQKPAPVVFAADKEWRIIPPVPTNQPYLKTFDLLQWISETLPIAFTYDFINYTSQIQKIPQYFTPNGWKEFSELLSNYVSEADLKSSKLFTSAGAAAAPYIINQGMIANDEYGWWIQIPIKINYSSYATSYATTVTLRVLVVRVSTLNNLSGVAIDNIQRV